MDLRERLKLKSKLLIGLHKKSNIRNPRILHDRKVVFIHIPKTAGNSVTRLLTEFAKEEEPKSPKIAKHAKAQYVKAYLGDEKWEEYFKFSFVRNPWDLMVSSYHWWCKKAVNIKYHKKKADEILKMGSFDSFLDSKYGKNYINERRGSYYDWLTDTEGNIMVDYVGKLETIEDDWKKICQLSGLPHHEIVHVNKTKRKPYQEYYNKSTRELIENRFSWSIEKFGYKF
jgi:hypothetical protein